MNLETRTGITSYCLPYSEAGVTRMAKGRIRLKPGKNYSAGLLGEPVREGTFTIEVTGRLDSMDPSAVFAVWTYSDATKDEIDVIEVSRWGNRRHPFLFRMGHFVGGVLPEPHAEFADAAFNRYRFELWIGPNYFTCGAVGVLPDGRVFPLGSTTRSREKMKTLGNLRIAIWVPLTGYSYPDVASRGNMTATIESVVYTAPVPSKEETT